MNDMQADAQDIQLMWEGCEMENERLRAALQKISERVRNYASGPLNMGAALNALQLIERDAHVALTTGNEAALTAQERPQGEERR